MKMNKLIWVGPRESDIKYTGDLFDGLVVLYGDNEAYCQINNCRLNHNNINETQTEFMHSGVEHFVEDDENVKFYAYNPNLMYEYEENILKHFVCLNDKDVMDFLDSKISFRKYIEHEAHTLHSEMIKGEQCRIAFIKKLFPNNDHWIIQSDIASGGYQTFIMDEENEKQVQKELVSDGIYLVSPFYQKNIPVNIHAIIYEDEVYLTPGSVQIMVYDQNRLLYRGADYIQYKTLSTGTRDQFEQDVIKVCKKIQALGYRGILGIDAIVVDGVAQLLEINNRFQGSTILINKALEDMNMPSLQKLNYESFYEKKSKLISGNELKSLDVHYSIYTYINNREYNLMSYTHDVCRESKSVVEIIDDGYREGQDAEEDAYLYRVIYRTNICEIDSLSEVHVHQNILEPDNAWVQDIIEYKDFKKLKISLLNQGVIIDENVKRILKKNGGMREGVNYAVDLTLENGCIVNAPLSVKFCDLSPFHIDMKDDDFALFYYGNYIETVKIPILDPISEHGRLKNGIPVSRICLLATDRLRIQNTDSCTFKEMHVPCRFCEVQYRDRAFGLNDIIEAVDMYFNNDVEFRHILIGGYSNRVGNEKENILGIISHIRARSQKPIYLMILPPVDAEDVTEYVNAGVTEIGFNLECFDRNLAQKYMPGKGKIPFERYVKAMQQAVALLGNTGAVRSAFVVGLEPEDSFLRGIEFVCELGVAPILSVFRPIPETDMSESIPMTNEKLLDIYGKAEQICEKHHLRLGPDCVDCQNNTLSFDLPKE